MQCPRLNHFVRFNPNGTVSRCGHMVNAPEFNSLLEMENSEWLYKTKQLPWPKECIRCRETEALEQDSIRVHTIRFHQQQTKQDYLIVGGVLDNICNSGCLTCDQNHSTKIGSLTSKTYPIVDNTNRFWQLPLNRIVKLDINGGEPSSSKNYLDVLKNLPANVKEVRINTNCSNIIEEIEHLINRGVKVTVTVSLDGVEATHDYVRWPIKWDKFYKNLMTYSSMPGINLNTWTTVSALNIHNFTEIKKFVAEHHLAHSYAFLHDPDPINVKYSNTLTEPYKDIFPGIVAVDRINQIDLDEFIKHQKGLRGL
jgi:sulfatase maturation enzyme AslB (radical SAM superfamily)